LGSVALDPDRRARLSAGAVAHARDFSWDRTTDALLATYADAGREHDARLRRRLVTGIIEA